MRGLGHASIAWLGLEPVSRVYDLHSPVMQLKGTRKVKMGYRLVSCVQLFRIESVPGFYSRATH
jgi:hypothetical protein